jgi:hypothetical protein
MGLRGIERAVTEQRAKRNRPARAIGMLATETLRPAVPDERQPGCFALEEEKGGHWTGSGV